MQSIIGPDDTWLLWSALLAIAAFGLWSDRYWLGRWLSGAVVALIGGIALSNLAVIPAASPVYDVVYGWLLPLAIPLVLFEADLGRILREAGRVLSGFLAGAVGTVSGALIAFATIATGPEAPALTASLAAAYTGGTANLLAVGQAAGLVPGDSLAAVLAAGNLAVILYLVVLFALRRFAPLVRGLGESTAERLPAAVVEPPRVSAATLVYSLAASACICSVGFAVQARTGVPGTALLTITLVSVALATALPATFARLECASPLGFALLHVLFAAIGASASVRAVIAFGPVLLLFAGVMLLVHFVFVFVGARLLRLDVDEMLIASNACALGAPTAAAMAIAFRRSDLVVPALLCGVLGYATGNFVGLGLFALLR